MIKFKPKIRKDLKDYVNSVISREYRKFDQAHQENHARQVIDRALSFSRFYPVNPEVIYVAAAFHDLGLSGPRETHHLLSGKLIREDKKLRAWFTEEDIEKIAQAAEDHRASENKEPRTIEGKIIAEADRIIDPELTLERTLRYGLEHYNGTKEQQITRAAQYLKQKYGPTGYVKTWLPETKQELKHLRLLLQDEQKLKQKLENIMTYKIKRFSKEDNHDTGKIIAAGVTGTALVGNKSRLSKKLHKTAYKNSIKSIREKDPKLSEEEKRITEKLLEKAKKQGINVVKDTSGKFDNSAYMGGGYSETVRHLRDTLKNYGDKTNNRDIQKMVKQLDEAAIKELGKTVAREYGKDSVVLGKGLDGAEILSHEIGHAQYNKNRSKDILGRLGHTLHAPSSTMQDLISGRMEQELGGKAKKIVKGARYTAEGALIGGGFRRGKNSVTTDENGNIKINHKKALKSAAIGGTIAAPLLIAEGAASRQGLQMMREAGASKELMKQSRKILGNAFGTYASKAIHPVMSELGGHELGVAYGIHREKKKSKKQNTP